MTDKELVAKAREVERHVRSTLDTTVADLVRDLADALEGRSESYTELLADYEAMKARTEAEPEWEYQWGEPGETFEGFDPYATYEEARSAMQKDSDYESHRVMRRRAAGPWEPVGGDDA